MSRDGRQKVVDELAENSFVIFADGDGARMYSKLRGATADEIGLMLGSAQASLDRQIQQIRQHIDLKGGERSVAFFDAGLEVGRNKMPYDEGLEVRERQKPEGSD